MRVLATADAVGGVWTYVLELADALEPLGIELHAATMGAPPDERQRAEAARSALSDLHVSSFALEWEDDPWRDVDAAGDWLLELEAELRPDVVQVNGYAHAPLDWAAPAVVVAHSDVVSWWRAVEGGPPPRRLDEYRRRVARGLEAADAVCAPTRAVLDDLRESFGFEGGIVVPNGRRASGVRGLKKPLVAGLGRFWDEAKNVAALERVADRIAWPVELAGPGTRRGRVDADEAEALLARATIFAAPARYEPFGLTVLEAAHAGCALVLGDIPSLREVWGEAARYVAPDDDDMLAHALNELAADDEGVHTLAARARERATGFTPEAMAAAMTGVYEAVLARTGAAA